MVNNKDVDKFRYRKVKGIQEIMDDIRDTRVLFEEFVKKHILCRFY